MVETGQSELRTPRLVLRQWRSADEEPFAAMNADPRVMEHFPALLSRAESDEAIGRFQEHFRENGFGRWVVEVPGTAEFLGFVGLHRPHWQTSFTPCVEIGWRIAADFWGQGFASEAAREVLRFGFHSIGLGEIVSFTVPDNRRSRRVMERIGMVHLTDQDFAHPALPSGHPLSRHVLYRITRDEFSNLSQ